jgi:germination protein M
MKMKRFFIILLLLTLVMDLNACSNKSNTNSEDSSEVGIYYVNSKTSALVCEKYQLISTKQEEQIDELLYMLRLAPENLLYKSALMDVAVVRDYYFNDDGSLTIDFEPSYAELTGIPEILCRAAIVKTLTQLEGVEYIQFNVNGQPLLNADGDLVGIMTKEDFIDNTGTETKVKLYFADEKGDALVEYLKEITYNGTGSLEELVLKELLAGPEQIGMYRTVPEGTVLNKVEMKEGICYVDFNKKFMDKISGLSDEVVIYSIVNTLVELPYIKKVQFQIDGEAPPLFGDGLNLDGYFERDLSLLKES